MTDAIINFFDDLSETGYEPTLQRATGTIRFDVEEGHVTQRWFVEVNRGKVAVARRNAKADVVVRGDRGTFEHIVAGELNAFSSLLRGTVQVELSGPSELLVLFQRYTRARAHRIGGDNILGRPHQPVVSKGSGR